MTAEARPAPPAAPSLPASRPLAASAVLRRSLLLWGLGHIALGDRRGWLLVIAHPLGVLTLAVLALLLIEGTRWMLVFPALLLLLVVWFGQAFNAYRTAVALGAQPGGELQVALFLPVVLLLVTAFWLLGGSAGSPATTLRAYVSAWEDGRGDGAAMLFAAPTDPTTLVTRWAAENAYLRQHVAVAAATYGAQSGIDPAQPFNSLRFSEAVPTTGEMAVVTVELVRRQRVETVLLGFIPTATQQTVVVEELGTVRLRALPVEAPGGLEWLRTGSRVWRIDSVDIRAGS